MKKILFLLNLQLLAAGIGLSQVNPVTFMKIAALDSAAVRADAGSAKGVERFAIYLMKHNGTVYGKAEVTALEPETSTLTILELKKHWQPQVYDHLTLDRSMEARYSQACRLDQRAPFEAFLRTWPKGEKSDDVRARLEQLPPPAAGEIAAMAPPPAPPLTRRNSAGLHILPQWLTALPPLTYEYALNNRWSLQTEIIGFPYQSHSRDLTLSVKLLLLDNHEKSGPFIGLGPLIGMRHQFKDRIFSSDYIEEDGVLGPQTAFCLGGGLTSGMRFPLATSFLFTMGIDLNTVVVSRMKYLSFARWNGTELVYEWNETRGGTSVLIRMMFKLGVVYSW
ncbi:hypothetical protein JXO52_05345 [bacterium]|nr:hypothetical protein [bacterium]